VHVGVVVAAGAVVGVATVALARWTRSVAGVRSHWLRGRPLVPLGCVLGAGAAVLAVGWVELLTFLVLALGCALLVATDLATHRLPDAIVGPVSVIVITGLTVAAATTGSWGRLGQALAAALAVLGCYLVLALVTPAGLGLGDVKLAGLLGAFLGWQGWPQVLAGTLAAFVLNGVVVALLLATRRVSRGGEVAFGPWLVVGAAVACGWG
jgi:leader peptidase (prepilin peptidase)/N-methyltransferase